MKSNKRRGLMAIALIAMLFVAITLMLSAGFAECAYAIGAASIGMTFLLQDYALTVTRALPAGASAVTSGSIGLGLSARGDFLANMEFLLTVPALAVGQLADTTTVTYDIIASDTADLASPTTIVAGAVLQTGAGGAGAAGNTYRYRPPTKARNFYGVKATKTGSASAAAASLTFALVG